MSSILKVDQIQLADGSTPTAGDLGLNTTGSVLQVVQNSGINGSIYSSDGLYVSTPYSGTITPKYSTSKILATFSFSVLLRGGGNSAAAGFSLLRNGTRLTTAPSNTHELFAPANELVAARQSYVYLDSPTTTNALTYSLEAWLRYSGQTTEFDSRDSTWTVTLMEIAG